MTNETASATAPPAAREARPGDVVYERNSAGYVLLGLVTVGGTMEDVPGRSKAQIAYMHFSPRGMDPSGVNGNVYEWQPKWSLIGVTTCGTVQADYTLWSPGAEARPAELAANVPGPGEVWTCPRCTSTTGRPVAWDHGTDPDTGYADRGEGCTECTPGGRR